MKKISQFKHSTLARENVDSVYVGQNIERFDTSDFADLTNEHLDKWKRITADTTQVYDRKLTEDEIQSFVDETPKCEIALYMFDQAKDNTWVFAGGAVVAGGFNQTQGIRNYIGQFEEYIRWTKRGSSIMGRQRYTINTGKPGRTLTDVNDEFDSKVAVYDPRALAVFVGEEDYQAGQNGIQSFKEALAALKEKALRMRNGTGYLVIQTPYAQTDSTKNENAAIYSAVVKDFYDSLSFEQKKKVMVVDHFVLTNQDKFKMNCVDNNGRLNAKGHLEIARELSKAVHGCVDDFPVSEMDLNQVPIQIPLEYRDFSKQIEFSPLQQRIQKMVSSSEAVTWMFVGDSITHGAVYTKGYDSIHQIFEKYIRDEKGRKDDVVINTAVAGATTEEQESNSNERLDKYYADVVIVMLGTNDAADSLVPLEQYRMNLENIVDKIHAKGAVAVIRTPNPLRSGDNRATNHPRYAQVIRDTAQSKGAVLVDHYAEWIEKLEMRSYLWQDGYWNADSIHPNANGQLNMAQALIRDLGLAEEASQIYNL